MSVNSGDAKVEGTAKAKSTSPIEVTIDRSKWRCGGDSEKTAHGPGDTALLGDKGFMCCLGFASKACGVPKKRHELEKRIKALGTPLFFTLPVNPIIEKKLTRITRRATRCARRAISGMNTKGTH